MFSDTIPPIKDARQYRFLNALLERPRGIPELERIVGCNHSPAEKRKLVQQGWGIGREIITVKDRDGKTTNPSLYYLSDDAWQEKARIACAAWEARERGAVTPPSAQELAKVPTGNL